MRKFQVADAWADVEETWRSIRLRPAQFVDFLTQVPLDGWTVGRLDVSWTFRAVILREYGRKVFFTLRYPEKKVNLHEPPHNDTLDC